MKATLHTAGLIRRGAALAVDATAAGLATLVGFATGVFEISLFRVPPDWFWTEWWFKYWLDAPELLVRPVVGFALFLLLWTALLEAWRGRTLGDAILGLRVVQSDGWEPSKPRVVLRMLGNILNITTLGLGWLWIIVSPSRRAFHDYLSGTFVVVRSRS